MEEYKYGDITHKIIGAAMEVHRHPGNGFHKVIYQRALAVEFKLIGLSFIREQEMSIFYKQEPVGSSRVDFFVEEKIMVELKALIAMDDGHLAQGLNYLEAYNMGIGLLINFGSKSLQHKRLLNKKFISGSP